MIQAEPYKSNSLLKQLIKNNNNNNKKNPPYFDLLLV